ncbi:MAG: restriction endonuclease subunit S [Bradyrhizobium sp.]|uniref:restriction endonuclease subunit S n=1 Tax=Bradyrhizobium sp. TaxID=376 RepID=UPI0025C6D8E0|nr:restriction endonuclease subunit S [Bradyrhizobium sp.]MBI5263651.1 restriction endonuclease subunit S [Bradyrhizobium sp.]
MTAHPAPTLDEICEFIVDCLHRTAPTQDTGFPLIRTPNIGKGRLIFDDVYRVSDETYETWTQRAVPEAGDLILAREAPAGNIAVVKNGERVCLGQRTVHLRPNPDKVDSDFLCYFLLTPSQQGVLLAGETGATAKHVNMGDIRKLKLEGLPDLQVQKRAGAILSAYDDLIENNRRRMALLEEAARQLYREWFVRLRFPGHEHIRITNGVPEGWERNTLGDLCEEVRESVKPDALEPSTPYIGLEHMPRRSISLSEWGTAEQVTSSKHRFRQGDILFGKIRPYFHKVGVAFVDGVASSDAIVIRPLDSALHGLVLMTVSSDLFVAVTAQTMREGSKMPRADWKQMQAYRVPLPPHGLLSSFESVVRSTVEQLKTLTFANHKLRAARDLLLPRLMSGEIAV